MISVLPSACWNLKTREIKLKYKPSFDFQTFKVAINSNVLKTEPVSEPVRFTGRTGDRTAVEPVM